MLFIHESCLVSAAPVGEKPTVRNAGLIAALVVGAVILILVVIIVFIVCR